MTREEILELMPWVKPGSVFYRLAGIQDLSELSYEERRKLDHAIRHYHDTLSVMHGAEDEGMAKGMAEGMAKGMAEGMAKGRAEALREANIKYAKAMKGLGMSFETIAQITGLEKAEIESL